MSQLFVCLLPHFLGWNDAVAHSGSMLKWHQELERRQELWDNGKKSSHFIGWMMSMKSAGPQCTSKSFGGKRTKGLRGLSAHWTFSWEWIQAVIFVVAIQLTGELACATLIVGATVSVTFSLPTHPPSHPVPQPDNTPRCKDRAIQRRATDSNEPESA